MKKIFVLLAVIFAICSCESGEGQDGKFFNVVVEPPQVFSLGQSQILGISTQADGIASLSVRNVPLGWDVLPNLQRNNIKVTCTLGAYQSGEFDFDLIVVSSSGQECVCPVVVKSEVFVGSPYYNGDGVVGVVVATKTISNNVGIIAAVRHLDNANWYGYSDWIAGMATTGAWRMPTFDEGLRIFNVYAGGENNTEKGARIENTLSSYGTYKLNGDMYWSSTEYKSSVSSSVYYQTFGEEGSGYRPALAKSGSFDGLAIMTF